MSVQKPGTNVVWNVPTSLMFRIPVILGIPVLGQLHWNNRNKITVNNNEKLGLGAIPHRLDSQSINQF